MKSSVFGLILLINIGLLLGADVFETLTAEVKDKIKDHVLSEQEIKDMLALAKKELKLQKDSYTLTEALEFCKKDFTIEDNVQPHISAFLDVALTAFADEVSNAKEADKPKLNNLAQFVTQQIDEVKEITKDKKITSDECKALIDNFEESEEPSLPFKIEIEENVKQLVEISSVTSNALDRVFDDDLSNARIFFYTLLVIPIVVVLIRAVARNIQAYNQNAVNVEACRNALGPIFQDRDALVRLTAGGDLPDAKRITACNLNAGWIYQVFSGTNRLNRLREFTTPQDGAPPRPQQNQFQSLRDVLNAINGGNSVAFVQMISIGYHNFVIQSRANGQWRLFQSWVGNFEPKDWDNQNNLAADLATSNRFNAFRPQNNNDYTVAAMVARINAAKATFGSAQWFNPVTSNFINWMDSLLNDVNALPTDQPINNLVNHRLHFAAIFGVPLDTVSANPTGAGTTRTVKIEYHVSAWDGNKCERMARRLRPNQNFRQRKLQTKKTKQHRYQH